MTGVQTCALPIFDGVAGNRLYGWDEEVSSNAIEVHLHNLRRKLGADWIRNVRGVGYKLVEPRSPPAA